jgi:8-amino-7-oxononanoate synthase
MADFCSALYLGLRHPARTLPHWPQLTLGKPAALQEPGGALELASELAALQGCEAALLMPSTLHLFWDVFGTLAAQAAAGLVLLVDGGTYPIMRWGAQQAVAMGVPLQLFARGDAAAAEQLAHCWRRRGRRPVLLADGYCPGASRAPPLASYARIARQHGGYLVLDDTQVLGLSGVAGGGSLSAHGIAAAGAGAEVLVGASLAKGFGAPLAVLAGSLAMIKRLAERSQTRRHCSPPAMAVIAAGRAALRINRACGDRLRARLARRVEQLRGGLAERGIACGGGAFPVQVVRLPPGARLAQVHAALARDGVHVVPQLSGSGGALSFLLRADHRAQEVSHAIASLQRQLQRF